MMPLLLLLFATGGCFEALFDPKVRWWGKGDGVSDMLRFACWDVLGTRLCLVWRTLSIREWSKNENAQNYGL